MKKKKSVRREIIEWVVFIGILAFLFGTGLHRPVFGFLQGLILKTGIIQPAIDESSAKMASYDFVLIDENGGRMSFSEFRGEVVFINFWATWCPPCIAEMPDIQSLYEEMNDDGVRFVLISLDEDFQKAVDFVERKDFTFPIYQLGSPLPAVFESQAIPTTYVVSPDGRIVVSKSGMAKYNTKKFKGFLKELQSG
jgi:thiol-disulfide isomerase/thioredoxin